MDALPPIPAPYATADWRCRIADLYAAIRAEPDPQAGSQIVLPGWGAASFASSRETGAGVKNSPAFFPASEAKREIR